MPELPRNICGQRKCGRRIKWAITMRGANIALDPTPDPSGTIELQPAADRGLPIATFHVNEPPAPGVDRYVVHYATCPARSKGPRGRTAGWPAHTRSR